MIECSSCGQIMGHIYNDYYRLTKKLTEELTAGNLPPTGDYNTEENGDLTDFITTYYTWFRDQDPDQVPRHEPCNIIARGLLRTRDLKVEHLPFGSAREEDGQMSIHEPRICCLRMLQTDPAMTEI